jgi:virulence-associated protein VapD
MKKKKFDSVKMMRDIRDKLTKRYLENPQLEISDLQKVRKKYKIKTQKGSVYIKK